MCVPTHPCPWISKSARAGQRNGAFRAQVCPTISFNHSSKRRWRDSRRRQTLSESVTIWKAVFLHCILLMVGQRVWPLKMALNSSCKTHLCGCMLAGYDRFRAYLLTPTGCKITENLIKDLANGSSLAPQKYRRYDAPTSLVKNIRVACISASLPLATAVALQLMHMK